MGMRDRFKRGVRSALRAGRGQDKNVVSQRRTAPREVRRVSDARAVQGVSESGEASAPVPTSPPVLIGSAKRPPPIDEKPAVVEPPDVDQPASLAQDPVAQDPVAREPVEAEVKSPVVEIGNSSQSLVPPGESGDESVAIYNITIVDPKLEKELVFPCREDEFILDAAERAGFDLPSSCRGGACLVCAGRVEEGTYLMDEQYVLEEDQIADGFMLLCWASPTSDGRYKSQQEEVID